MTDADDIFKDSPGCRRMVAELDGRPGEAREAALDEFVVLVAQLYDLTRADQLAEQYEFTRKEIREQATQAVKIMRQVRMPDLAQKVEKHYRVDVPQEE